LGTERFDVVIPAFDEETHIERCLDSVFAQDYPPELFHVWVVDAGSTDATAAIVRARAERHEGRLSLITGKGRLNAAQALNAAIGEGSAEWIARVDAHSTIDRDYLRNAAEAIEREDADLACVGGQPRQEGETAFGRALALARGSRFGVGGSVYADRRERAWVDTVQCGVYRRAALDAVGRFNTEMLVAEDEECNWRIRKAGYRILLDTRLGFAYTTRSSWSAAYRQYRNYGRGRVRVLAAHDDFLRGRHLIPSTWLIALAVLAVLSAFSGTARTVLAITAGVYVAAATVAAVFAAGRRDARLVPRIVAAFVALHAGYGVGILVGFAQRVPAGLGRGTQDTSVARR
jgi:succinoglycan biosynthesis protein ExoA